MSRYITYYHRFQNLSKRSPFFNTFELRYISFDLKRHLCTSVVLTVHLKTLRHWLEEPYGGAAVALYFQVRKLLTFSTFSSFHENEGDLKPRD